MLERQITLQAGDETYVLSPSLEVLRAIARKWPNYVDALDAVRKLNVEIIIDVIAAGAALKPDRAAQVVVAAGVGKAQEATAEVLAALFNPGGDEGGQSSGNP